MICIFREFYPGALESEHGRSLSCKAKWLETSAENLRSAIGAFDHNPWVQQSNGQLLIEIDGVFYDREQLPKAEGKDLLRRCRYWMSNLYRVRSSAITPRPVFGL